MDSTIPLAHHLRPTTLDEIIGQDHLLGPEAAFRRAVNEGRASVLYFGDLPGAVKRRSQPCWQKPTIDSSSNCLPSMMVHQTPKQLSALPKPIETTETMALFCSSTRFIDGPPHSKMLCFRT